MWQSRDLEGRKQRKLHFSAHKQLTDHGSNQMAGLENSEKHTEAPGAERSVHKAHSTEGELRALREAHQSPRHRGQGWGAEGRSTHSPCPASFGLRCREGPGTEAPAEIPGTRGQQ